jgi:uncharacterized protein (TIGR02453 family)
MTAHYLLDTEIFPPFQGFSLESIDFLKKLKKNNNREWFKKNKSGYEELIKFPMQAMIASLREPMAKLLPEIDVNPKRNMFRVYRDTRFSKNKTPYKTHVAAVFHLKGHWQDSAGYYVHIEPGNIYVGGGIYMPDSDQLKLIRHAIAERAKEFRLIMENKTFKKRFGSLEGDQLHRAPLGYPIEHPMIEWLKYKSYYTGVEWKEKECYSPKFINKTVLVYQELSPLIRFLNEALGKI